MVPMKHVMYANKSLLMGDEAADLLAEYAAALAEYGHADNVVLRAVGADGTEVDATFVLNSSSMSRTCETPFFVSHRLHRRGRSPKQKLRSIAATFKRPGHVSLRRHHGECLVARSVGAVFQSRPAAANL